MIKKLLPCFLTLCSFYMLNAQVVSTHPRLFLDPATITKLQLRAANNTPEWQEVQDRLSGISGLNSFQVLDQVYEGQEYAFFHALNFYASGNIASRDSAVSLFKEYFYHYTEDSSMYWDSGYESRNTLPNVAILYDWLYPYMSTQFRNDVHARLVLWADWILYQPNIYGQFGSTYYYEGNNYTMGHFYGITAAGYSIHSEDPIHGNRYIEVSDSVLPLLLNFSNTRLNNGDADEGWGYGAGYAANFFKTLAVIKTATIAHIDHFSATTYDEGVAKFIPFATLPNLDHMLAEGDWARESTGEIWDFNRIVADLISTYSNDSICKRTSKFYGDEVMPVTDFLVTSYRWYPFLFSNQEITPLNYRTQNPFTNKYWYTDTIGTDQFIQRTGWVENSQWISYRGGGRYGDHAHNGAGHFSLYENGWLLIDKNIQSASGIEGTDENHNVVLIESMSDQEMYPVNGYEDAEHTFQKQIEIVPEYTYFWSNTAPIYLAREVWGSGEANVVIQKERQFFYLPAIKKMAIFDMVETELPTDDKTFTTHFWDIPTLNGYTASYSNDSTTAYVTTCYPIFNNAFISGQSLMVQNNTAQAKNYFMHLVHTQPVGTTMNPIFALNQEANNLYHSNFYGSYYQENDTTNGSYVLLFNGNDPTYQFDSVVYRVPVTTSQIKNYLMGVIPNHTYYVKYELLPLEIKIHVYLNNVAGSTAYTSTNAGVLYFELNSLEVGIGNIDEQLANIFYNGTSSTIYIKSIEAMGNCRFSLLNLQGQVLLQRNTMTGTEFSIPVEEISAGIYIVQMITEKGMISKKLYLY
jgi:hypothetical protein